MILLQTILNQLKMKGAQLFRSITLNEGQAASIAMIKSGFIKIPRGYLNFLNLTDGLIWKNVEFFSCGQHERAGTVFNQPTLLEYHTKYAQGYFFKHRLVLGYGLERLFCYNAIDRSYEWVDRDSLEVILRLPRFEDLLYQIIFLDS